MRPEASVACGAAFDDPDWRFSIDWDGARAFLVLSADGAMRLQAETDIDLADRFPEIVADEARPEALAGREATLDGAVAVLDEQGRPHLGNFGRRLAAGGRGAHVAPAVYLATDLLHLDEAATHRWPLDRRLEALSGLGGSGGVIQVPDHVSDRGTALADAASERGLTALLARRGDAPYRHGLASPDRLRIALTPQTTCIVLGVEHRVHGLARLLLGEFEAGRLAFAGRVQGPRDLVVENWMQVTANRLTTSEPSSSVPLADSRTQWLRPGLTATVSYTGRAGDGILREPVLLAVRDDVDPTWCVRRTPMAPPRGAAARAAFTPTVLVPLPFGEGALLPRSSK